MEVNILHAGEVVGSANLDPVDPPMGVAGGRFVPASAYDRHLHANVLDGDDNKRVGSGDLTVCLGNEALTCAGVYIEDYHETLQEITVTILGIASPDYEAAFDAHPLYEAYWRIEGK